MPTNDERREVAAKLRELAQESARCGDDGVGERACRVLLGPRVDLLDVVDAHFPLARLADLIEPEERTCRAGVFPDGAWAYVICCTECGYAIGGTWSDLGTARRMARAQHKFTNFCPNCGARVVQQ